MNNKEFYKEIGLVDADLIDAVCNPMNKKVTFGRKVLLPIAACFSFIIIFGVAMLIRNSSNTEYSLSLSSDGVRVSCIEDTPNILSYSSLSERLSETEMFNKYDTDIFEGTILEIKNIEISFSGLKDYRAIAKIKVNQSYRGKVKAGDTTTILLPCSINTNTVVEDTKVVSSMEEGMVGIFMPIKYDETSINEINGEKLYLVDIAEYGLRDGERFAFLETENGLVFDRDTYTTISDASSLSEIEIYIKKMIQQ